MKVIREVKKYPKIDIQRYSGREASSRYFWPPCTSQISRGCVILTQPVCTRKRTFISTINRKKGKKRKRKTNVRSSLLGSAVGKRFYGRIDENELELFGQKQRIRVWRKRGKQLQNYIRKMVKHGEVNIMVQGWTVFSLAGIRKLMSSVI